MKSLTKISAGVGLAFMLALSVLELNKVVLVFPRPGPRFTVNVGTFALLGEVALSQASLAWKK